MKGYVNLTHTNNAKFNNLQEQISKKQSSAPKENIPLINEQTGKIDNAYIPKSLGETRKFAGTFGSDGIISASAYASEVNGKDIRNIDLDKCIGYEFSYVGDEIFVLDDLEIYKNDIIVCNGNIEPNWTLFDNSDRVISVNGQTGAIENLATLDDVHTVLILGANGTIGTNANFVVEDAESYIPYRNNLTEFIFSGIIPVTGEVDLTKEVTIDFGDTSYYLFDALDISRKLTLGDLNFALKESLVTGYNYLFRTVFFNNSDLVGFAVLPAKDEVLSLTSDQMDNYLAEGGLPNGQLVICSKVITNGYTEGGIYRFKITYPNTYEFEELSAGGGTSVKSIDITDGTVKKADFGGTIKLTVDQMKELKDKGTITVGGETFTDDDEVFYVSDENGLGELKFTQQGSILISDKQFKSHVQVMIEFETDGMHYGADFILHPYDSSMCLVSYNFVAHTGTAYLDESGYININVPDNLTFSNVKGHYIELGG